MARMGEIIDGKYEVLREIGRGGMSVVYLAMDKRLNKQWAIKEFRKDKDDASKQVALKALLDEANLMKKLDHPTLPRIVDIIDSNQNVYVIMDYIEGESLNKVLDAYGAQPEEAVIEWAKQLSEVLDYLHTQSPPIIYRDMKPANIMLKPDGTVRLIDFGIAREYKEGKDGDTEAIGTRGYAAPEQFGGRGQTDARTDIYSLGVTLYHLVTGKNPAEPPYELYPIRHWNPSFSSGFEWLIQKCTQLNPGDRYQSCAEVTYVLENLGLFETEYRKKQKSKIRLFFASCIASVVCLLIGFLGYGQARQANDTQGNLALDNKDWVTAATLLKGDKRPYQGLYDSLNDEFTNEEKKFSDDKDIIGVFAFADNLEKEDYIRMNYEYGKLYYSSYTTDGADKIITEKASKHYLRALAANMQYTEEENKSVLTDYEINRAKSFYLLYFISENSNGIREGESITLNADALSVFENPGDFGELFNMTMNGTAISDFNQVAWDSLVDLVDIVQDKRTEISDGVKLETYRRVIVVLEKNQNPFYKLLSSEGREKELVDIYNKIIDDTNKVVGLDEKDEKIKQEVLASAQKSLTIVKGLVGEDTGEGE